jgi:peptidoglycan-associated lipoprotein
MNRSLSRQSAAILLTVMTMVSVACKKAPAPPPPPPATTTAITPATPALPAPTVTLRADASTITRGGTVTLTWESRNAAAVDIQPGIGSVTPLASGTRQVSPTSSVTYQVTATGPGGTPAQDTVRITVNDPPPAAVPSARGGSAVAPPAALNLTAQQLFDRDMQPINFDYDKSDIREDQKGKLQTATAYMKANSNVRITIEGNADERGSEEYNLALGDRRANAVKQYLAAQGIAENRLSSVSYGEERPACSTQTEDCFAQNRRAAFRINP